MRKRVLLAAASAAGLWMFPGLPSAYAYPNSVIFVPTGDARPLGQLGAFVYTSMAYDPTSGPGASWAGLNGGVLPAFSYGSTGTGFGGLEVGIDAANPTNYPGDAPAVKPMLNFKAQVLTETASIPFLSIGGMDLDPFKTNRSANLLYFVATKTLGAFGRLTLGMGNAFTSDRRLFSGTAPFWGDSEFLVGGYESPQFGQWNIDVDSIGGTSDLSSTNVALDYLGVPGTTIAVGGYFGNDRRNPATTNDGLFAYVLVNWDLAKK